MVFREKKVLQKCNLTVRIETYAFLFAFDWNKLSDSLDTTTLSDPYTYLNLKTNFAKFGECFLIILIGIIELLKSEGYCSFDVFVSLRIC